MSITRERICAFELGKVFKHEQENDSPPSQNALDFDDAGEFFMTSGDDESMRLYEVATGTCKQTLFSKRYGVQHITFTHHNHAVLCASKNRNWDNTIRYLSIYDNQYLRYFKGHVGDVTGLAMSPTSDVFMSSSMDQTVRFWDLRDPKCTGVIRPGNHVPACAYDPAGLVFAVAAGKDVKLYDAKDYGTGPFMAFSVNEGDSQTFVNLAFSNDGKRLLLSMSSGKIIVCDAFDGRRICEIADRNNENDLNIQAHFTPDGEYILAGSQKGTIHVWESATGHEVCKWVGHVGTTSVVKFNPRYMMAASISHIVGMWIPLPVQS